MGRKGCLHSEACVKKFPASKHSLVLGSSNIDKKYWDV